MKSKLWDSQNYDLLNQNYDDIYEVINPYFYCEVINQNFDLLSQESVE